MSERRNLKDETTAALEALNAEVPAPTPVGNTVAGMPEQKFRTIWISMLSAAMLKTGRGFRVDPAKRRQPAGAAMWRGERRADKVGTTKLSRGLMAAVAR